LWRDCQFCYLFFLVEKPVGSSEAWYWIIGVSIGLSRLYWGARAGFDGTCLLNYT